MTNRQIEEAYDRACELMDQGDGAYDAIRQAAFEQGRNVEQMEALKDELFATHEGIVQ